MASVTPQLARELYDYLLSQQRLTEGARVHLNYEEIAQIQEGVLPLLARDPVLLHLSAPIVIVGDIHGQFTDLLRYFKLIGEIGDCPWLFLGDYVDRGYNSLEVVTLLFCAKILFPTKVFLLRGNHETRELSSIYGFQSECVERFGDFGETLWELVMATFDHLPLAAVVGKRLFCVHGGISKDLPNVALLETDRQFRRPLKDIEAGPVLDLLWADPSKTEPQFAPNERGAGSTCGVAAAADFLCENKFDVIVRGHEVVNTGYDFQFHPEKTVLTVFSCPNYAYECSNTGAALVVDAALQCSFRVLYSRESYEGFEERVVAERVNVPRVVKGEQRPATRPRTPFEASRSGH
jgi:diadenosine tetraphosphatase ApaH/serine/threonine PP2A family protein phosphatase